MVSKNFSLGFQVEKLIGCNNLIYFFLAKIIDILSLVLVKSMYLVTSTRKKSHLSEVGTL